MDVKDKVSSETLKYAVVVTGKPVIGRLGGHMSKDGDQFIVIESEWGDTSQRYRLGDPIPLKVKTFESQGAANEFGLGWLGHPWWVDPLDFHVIRIKPVYKTTPDGWIEV